MVNLPKRDGEKNHNGFGFVTFKNLKDAQKAIETLNLKVDKLNGTKVAVDWCLPKNLYLKNTGNFFSNHLPAWDTFLDRDPRSRFLK